MKKIIASVLLACFGASILIAEVPASVTSSSDPFAGVEGVELTAVEEGEVEGGFYPAVVAGYVFVGALAGAGLDVSSQIVAGNKQINTNQVIAAAVAGGVTGLVSSTGIGCVLTATDALALNTASTVYGVVAGMGTKTALDQYSSNNASKTTTTTTTTKTTATPTTTSTSKSTSKKWFFW